MLKVSKKIRNLIEREFDTNDFTITKRVYIHSMYKSLCVDLVLFRIRNNRYANILRYFGDKSYSISGPYLSQNEIIEEIKYQIEKLWL